MQIPQKKRVAVGSLNPVKVSAVARGFTSFWPETAWEFIPVDVASGVSDQPMSAEESIRGALQRAHSALTALDAGFGVGLEGGLEHIDNTWYCCGWIAVVDAKGHEGVGSSVRMPVPQQAMDGIHEGQELGDVIDRMFKGSNLKQQGGFFGCMTNGVLTREAGYRDGVIAALSRYSFSELFE